MDMSKLTSSGSNGSAAPWGAPPPLSPFAASSLHRRNSSSASAPAPGTGYLSGPTARGLQLNQSNARDSIGAAPSAALPDVFELYEDDAYGVGHAGGSYALKRRRHSGRSSEDPEDGGRRYDGGRPGMGERGRSSLSTTVDGRPLAVTCTPCRARKIKCDSHKPTCDNCEKNPQDCVYPVKLKPGLRPGTGSDMMRRLEVLEDRVGAYESRVAEHETRLLELAQLSQAQWQQQPPQAQGPAPPHMAAQQAIPSSTGMSSLGRASMPFAPTPLAMATLGHSAGAPGGARLGGLPPLFPLADTPLLPTFSPTELGASSAGTAPQSGGAAMLDFSSLGAQATASPGAGSAASFRDPHVLPPDDVVRDLVALYFAHIHPWAPILPPPAADTDAAGQLRPPWDIVTYAMVVVALRLSTDPRLAAHGAKQQYRAAAKSHVISHAIESTSISSVQALALLALDLIGSDQGPSSWGILALLTRSAQHLGLMTEDDVPGGGGGGLGGNGAHSATPSVHGGYLSRAPAPSLRRMTIIPPPTTWREDESRRRLLWLIFCLDRYACVSTGWDFALADSEIKRRLPCADELWARDDWFLAPPFRPVPHRDVDAPPDPAVLCPLAYLVEALDVLGRAHQLQARVVEPTDAHEMDLRREMTMSLTSTAKRWMAGAPVADAAPPTAMTLVVQAIHHATLLKLNAYYAFPALSNGVPVEPYGKTCLTSARAVVGLCAVARDIGFISASSPLFIWSCWVAARVLFVHAFFTHQDQPDADFDAIVAALREQAAYWSLANQYVKLLERAKRKWLASHLESPAHLLAVPPSASGGGGGSADDAASRAAAAAALPEAIHVLLDLRRTAYSAVGANGEATPLVPTPPEFDLANLPAWAVQPLLGDLHNWFDLPAGLFMDGM